MRILVFRSSLARSSIVKYVLFSAPALLVEYWLESIGRPKYGAQSEVIKAGEDLEAKGLTEYLWDVLYWTWFCVALSGIFGDKAWWLWTIIPAYSAYAGYTTFVSARQGYSGLAGGAADGSGSSTGQSKRQQKMEKRGGRKVQYR